MTKEFQAKVAAAREALERVRDGRVERTVIKVEGARAYSETVPRDTTPPEGVKRIKKPVAVAETE